MGRTSPPPRQSTVELALPPLPEGLQHTINPYLNPRRAFNSGAKKLQPEELAASTERLSHPQTSKALLAYHAHVQEVLGASKCSLPASSMSTPPPSQKKAPFVTLENIVTRFYTQPLSAGNLMRANLERKYLSYTSEDTKLSVTTGQIATFLERQAASPSKAQASKKLPSQTGSGVGQQKPRVKLADYVDRFFTEPIATAARTKTEVLDRYMPHDKTARTLSPAEQRQSAERLAAGKR